MNLFDWFDLDELWSTASNFFDASLEYLITGGSIAAGVGVGAAAGFLLNYFMQNEPFRTTSGQVLAIKREEPIKESMPEFLPPYVVNTNFDTFYYYILRAGADINWESANQTGDLFPLPKDEEQIVLNSPQLEVKNET